MNRVRMDAEVLSVCHNVAGTHSHIISVGYNGQMHLIQQSDRVERRLLCGNSIGIASN